MFLKTISKNHIFVISFIFLCGIGSSCSLISSSQTDESQKNGKKSSARFEEPTVVGRIRSREITESSGLVASRCNEGVFWTHNDSGNGTFIFALDKKGEKLGTWKIQRVNSGDWEDLATVKRSSGECLLFIGDIGNNSRLRKQQKIVRVIEPKVSPADRISSKRRPRLASPPEVIRFVYPGVRSDSEALLIHPQTEAIYILTKRFSGASGVYKLTEDYNNKDINKLVKVGDVSLPAFPNGVVTGGEISSDGKRVILCDYFNGYELELPESSKNFDEIWKDEPSIIKLGKREQGEAICYSLDGNSVFATSEKRNSPLIEVKRK
ncbi:MAG: hypothetical protein HKN25_00575 [Pyrinomonadaceae bacterium]|nr:hypothetical protein [Pyrinomonadaceae bacterium]